MPELKRIPQEGKMNLDLHERILPPGQYREALNVNIGRSESAEVGTVENLLGNELLSTSGVTIEGRCIGSYRDNSRERIFFFTTTNDSFDQSPGGTHGVYQYDQISNVITPLVTSSALNFHMEFPITGISLIEDLLFWTDDRNEPRKINIDRARNNPNHYVTDVLLSVAKPAPFTAATITSAITDTEITSTFLEDRLPRFSYRWRFDDGEYSVLAPFTPIVFRSGITTIPAAEAAATGAVSGFVNNINSITFSVPITQNAGIVSVELIYTDSSTTNAYIVEDAQVTPTEGTVGFTYRSQDPFRTIPGSQITRVFDAVPRRAKSQEIAGGRIVYGNYLQNYNLPTVDFTVTSSARSGSSQIPNQYAKSRRTYEVGIVLSDASGRTTPVILSNGTVFVNNPGERLSINFADITQMEEFFSYKVVVKQRQQEYYNLFTSGQSRFGDNASKVPIDFTQIGEEVGTATGFSRPSSRSIYVNGVLENVTIGNNGNIVRPSGLGAGTFEVEPVESELDIFFESSTGGTIASLDGRSGEDILIEYYNCYLIDGVEANRVRMGFNDPAWDYGVRAHAVNEEFAGEERRANALIHSSGFFNSRTGLNQLNQFNEAEGGITLSLDPADGSIQLLYAEDTQLIIWQEDKVSRSPIDKDFIYSAEGGAVPVTSNTQYLGTVAPYAGEYGISTDPQSFAVYGTRKYFTDRNRGVVLRLSNDGLTEISQAGLSDFFRDALRTSTSVIGSFDEYHNTYNLTITGDRYTLNEDTNRGTASDGYFTIGFEEDVSGWVSFKSFQQESGTTLNNVYYTFSGGQPYQHNSLNVPRNQFYGVNNESHIDFIFNDGPSNVKTFNTIGYEGENGWECDFIRTDIDTIGMPPTPDTGFITTRLVVNGESPNTIVPDPQPMTIPSGGTATWVIQVVPISNQFVFNEALTDQVTLTVGAGLTLLNSSVTREAVFFQVSTTGALQESYSVTVGGSGANLAFQVTLLTINIGGTAASDPLIMLSDRSITLIDSVNFSTNSITLSPTDSVNSYIRMEDVSVDDSDIPDGIVSDTGISIVAAGSENVIVTGSYRAPMEPSGVRQLLINGSTTLKPLLTWDINFNENVPTNNFNTIITRNDGTGSVKDISSPIPVSPRDINSEREIRFTATLNSMVIGTDIISDANIAAARASLMIMNGIFLRGTLVLEDLVLDQDEGSVRFSVRSNIMDSDLTTTVDLDIESTPASVTTGMSNLQHLFNFDGGTNTFPFTSNIDLFTEYTPTNVSEDFIVNIDNENDMIEVSISEIPVPAMGTIVDGTMTDSKTQMVSIIPLTERLRGNVIVFDLDLEQRQRYFHTMGVAGGNVNISFFYPDTSADIVLADTSAPANWNETVGTTTNPPTTPYKITNFALIPEAGAVDGNFDINVEGIIYRIPITVP